MLPNLWKVRVTSEPEPERAEDHPQQEIEPALPQFGGFDDDWTGLPGGF
jgi:hypothetical protein